MADNADDIRQAIKKSRQEVADTRAAITEKVSVLEGRVQATVDEVKHAFDLHYQVQKRPWQMFGGSLLVGYLLGRRGGISGTTADTISAPSTDAQPRQSVVSEIRNQVHDDLATIKGAVFGAVISTLWALAKQALLSPAQSIDGIVTTPRNRPVDLPQLADRGVTSMTNGKIQK